MNTTLSTAIGAAAGIGTDVLATQGPPRRRTMILATGLITAAAIYPLARSRRPLGAAMLREMGGLLAAGAIASTAARTTPARARNAVAAGWAAHALFDVVHDSGADSLIPSWYPAMCAGYDLAVAGRLVTV